MLPARRPKLPTRPYRSKISSPCRYSPNQLVIPDTYGQMMVNQIRAGARSQVVVGDYTKRTPSPSDALSFSVGPNKSYALVPIATQYLHVVATSSEKGSRSKALARLSPDCPNQRSCAI